MFCTLISVLIPAHSFGTDAKKRNCWVKRGRALKFCAHIEEYFPEMMF